MSSHRYLDLYRAMLTARQIDQVEMELTNRGEAFFHVSGAGHEASVALILHLTDDDYLHCHYRDKALLLARGVSARDFFDSLYCKRTSHSRGRQMSAHMSDRALNVLSIVGPVGNSALQAVGVAAAIREQASQPIVLCSVGDGTTQEGEFLEAIAEAVRSQLPVLFFVENNRWAISTRTDERTFFSTPYGEQDVFYGVPIQRIDGRDVSAADERIGPIIREMRQSRGPAIVVFDVDRLTSHTNADDQTIYRDEADIARAQATGDPIPVLEQRLLRDGVSDSQLREIRQQVKDAVARAEEESARGPEPKSWATAKRPLPLDLTDAASEIRVDGGELVMRDAIREVLRWHLIHDPLVTLWGQDIDDPKGDVFGVTKGLGTEFGHRVKNSPLSESTIAGVSIGRALAGQRPVAFIQFADFLPIAYNQIASELGSLHWRTDGKWPAPVIIMVPCGGYRPGLGPFHAQSLESAIAHTPGIDVFMPSTAADAAGLLNAAFQSERPTVFFYPKSCLNDTENTTRGVERQLVPIGRARRVCSGQDITFLAWGNTVRLCQRAADALEKAGFGAELIDLRCLSPWDEGMVTASVSKTGRLIVVHEDNRTCGFGAEVVATITERLHKPVDMRRVTRPDTYVPCNFANQIEILPSFKSILAAAADMLDLELYWQQRAKPMDGEALIEAIGAGPSDETVLVVELFVTPGDSIERGDIVAALEATKSVFELTSPVSGVLEEVLVEEGDTIAVGAPMLRVKTCVANTRPKPILQEDPGRPVFLRRSVPSASQPIRRTEASNHSERQASQVGVGAICTALGGLSLSNEELLSNGVGGDGVAGPRMTSDDITRRTGIERRCWVLPGEDAVGLAAAACERALETERLTPAELDLVICCTTSPTSVTPSMACRVLGRLCRGAHSSTAQAYDVNAACSGYLYALQAGYDFLQSQPGARALLVTSEVLSPLLDPKDLDTAILFGDAASATILYGQHHADRSRGRLRRPTLSSMSDPDESLLVPLLHDGYIHMKGRKVFREAVRAMMSSLTQACRREEISIDDLRMIVPHQANQRIIDAIKSRVAVDVFSNIRQHGNTSSSSIPLCLEEVLPALQEGDRLGLCAFGGGFTHGAAIVEAL